MLVGNIGIGTLLVLLLIVANIFVCVITTCCIQNEKVRRTTNFIVSSLCMTALLLIIFAPLRTNESNTYEKDSTNETFSVLLFLFVFLLISACGATVSNGLIENQVMYPQVPLKSRPCSNRQTMLEI